MGTVEAVGGGASVVVVVTTVVVTTVVVTALVVDDAELVGGSLDADAHDAANSATEIQHAERTTPPYVRNRTMVVDATTDRVRQISPAGSGCLVRLHCLGDWPYIRLNSRLNCDELA